MPRESPISSTVTFPLRVTIGAAVGVGASLVEVVVELVEEVGAEPAEVDDDAAGRVEDATTWGAVVGVLVPARAELQPARTSATPASPARRRRRRMADDGMTAPVVGTRCLTCGKTPSGPPCLRPGNPSFMACVGW